MLIVCSSCQRHVRENEPACPFCREPLVALEVSPTAKPLRVALAIAAATAAIGCGKTSEPPATPVEMTDASAAQPMPPAPAYGLPPPEMMPEAGASTTPAPEPTTPPSRGTIRPLYGAPPIKR